ncbi:MAG: Fe-S-containing protein [Helicobacteraceae bacterium]|jgi:uncharacterized membrane protein|nr:Fe-S-containing protein [Helicobacteraceae bacterium]
MLQYLINVTNTLFFTLVLLGILLGGFIGEERSRRKSATIASALGFITALIVAALEHNTKVIVREYYNLSVLIPLIAAQIIFAVSVFCFPQSRISAAIVRFALALILFLLLAYGLVDIFLYPFEFAVGMDNIYNADFALKWFGYALALCALFILHYSVYQSTLSAAKKFFLPLAGAILFLIVIHETLVVLNALLARSLIPRSDALFDATFFISDNLNILFYIACVLTAAVAATLYIIENRKVFVLRGAQNALYADKGKVIAAENPAIRRKLIAVSREKRRFYIMTALSLFAVALFAKGGSYLAEQEIVITPPVSVTAKDGVISLPLDQFDDGRLKRFMYKTEGGAEVRFLVIKKDRGGYGVGLDACDICGIAGYYEQKNMVICSRCGVGINKATIGFRGGCNPVPFAYEITNSTLRILVTTLESEERRFR